jgi:hypothetical protein
MSANRFPYGGPSAATFFFTDTEIVMKQRAMHLYVSIQKSWKNKTPVNCACQLHPLLSANGGAMQRLVPERHASRSMPPLSPAIGSTQKRPFKLSVLRAKNNILGTVMYGDSQMVCATVMARNTWVACGGAIGTKI